MEQREWIADHENRLAFLEALTSPAFSAQPEVAELPPEAEPTSKALLKIYQRLSQVERSYLYLENKLRKHLERQVRLEERDSL